MQLLRSVKNNLMLRITTEPVTFGADATEYVGLLNTYSYICHRKKTYCILVPFYVKIKIIFGTVYTVPYRLFIVDPDQAGFGSFL